MKYTIHHNENNITSQNEEENEKSPINRLNIIVGIEDEKYTFNSEKNIREKAFNLLVFDFFFFIDILLLINKK